MKTDAQLQQDVREELKWDPSVTATDIGVEVKDGVVTLSGYVDSFLQKWNAERAAQRVTGVNALAVDMHVRLPVGDARTDADIARTAEHSLSWSTFPSRKGIKVMVEKGWVTLSGEVDWDFERQGAAAIVRRLMGVQGVSDQITLRPKIASKTIKSDIEAALKRRAQNDAAQISVTVDGSKVTLGGTTHSWAERDLASHAAWSAPGVRSVIDHITVTY